MRLKFSKYADSQSPFSKTSRNFTTRHAKILGQALDELAKKESRYKFIVDHLRASRKLYPKNVSNHEVFGHELLRNHRYDRIVKMLNKR